MEGSIVVELIKMFAAGARKVWPTFKRALRTREERLAEEAQKAAARARFQRMVDEADERKRREQEKRGPYD